MSKDYTPPSVTHSYLEYENGNPNISVVGSLGQHHAYWRRFNPPDYVDRIVQHGHTIPLRRLPSKKWLKNNKSSLQEPQFVREEIDSLVSLGAVVETDAAPHVVNPLTVSHKNGKKRLVLDLRHVNPHVYLRKCKIEGPETFAKYTPDAKYLFGFDLKSGYHHVAINPVQHCLLGFAFQDHLGNTRCFTYTVMPFGLNSAGFVFTQVLKVLIKYWRIHQIKILAFFDDGIAAADSWAIAVAHSHTVKQDLIGAGWIPNIKKSTWLPVAVLTWLGFMYDLVNMIVSATQEKIDKALDSIQEIQNTDTIPVRTLASISGQLIALHPALGDIVYLKSKRIAMLIANDTDWNRSVILNDTVRQELLFWVNYLPNNNGSSIHHPVACGAISYSDASSTGCASLITPSPDQQTIVVHREFSEPETSTSSTYRELITVYHGLTQTKDLLRDQSIRWHTDAKNVVSIIRKGSMKNDLQNLALRIFMLTQTHNINLCMSCLRRTENTEVDEFSRIIDYDDWGVHPKWFLRICQLLGPVTIYRFADPNNRKAQRFNSRFYWPETEAVDAYTQNWQNEVNWPVPPLYLIARTLKYLQLCKAVGIIVVPIWRSAYYWPLVQQIFTHQQQYIQGKLTLGDIFTHYKNRNSLFGSSEWNAQTLVLKLDYSKLP